MDNAGDLTEKEPFLFLGFPTYLGSGVVIFVVRDAFLIPLDFKVYRLQFLCHGIVHAQVPPASHTAHHLWLRQLPPPGQPDGAHSGGQVGLRPQLKAEEMHSNLLLAHRGLRDSYGVASLTALGQLKGSYRKEGQE